jgi:hypothetical protein
MRKIKVVSTLAVIVSIISTTAVFATTQDSNVQLQNYVSAATIQQDSPGLGKVTSMTINYMGVAKNGGSITGMNPLPLQLSGPPQKIHLRIPAADIDNAKYMNLQIDAGVGSGQLHVFLSCYDNGLGDTTLLNAFKKDAEVNIYKIDEGLKLTCSIK